MTPTIFTNLVCLLLLIGNDLTFNMNFESLNEDCVQHIFRFLNLNELYVVSKVCTYFRDVVKNFNMKLCYTMIVDIPDDYKRIQNFFTLVGHHIETIKIVQRQKVNHNLSYANRIIILLQTHCLNVKHLRFEHFIGIEITAFEKHFKLDTLELENSSLCSSLIPYNDLQMTIKCLTLSSCSSADINILLEYVKINNKICHLRMVDCCVYFDRLDLFTYDIISCLQNLQCLTLDHSVNCRNIEPIAKLANLKKLFLLHFPESKLTPLFESYANEECKLQELHFHQSQLRHNRIYEAISKIKSLEVLEMCKNFEFDNGHLRILSTCQSLKHLRCFDCISLVNDNGICYFVSKCSKLRILEIYWCSGVTLSTVDKIEILNTELARDFFTLKVGGRTGINWNDSGPIISTNEINRSTKTFRFVAVNEGVGCDTVRHNCVSWPSAPKDH